MPVAQPDGDTPATRRRIRDLLPTQEQAADRIDDENAVRADNLERVQAMRHAIRAGQYRSDFLAEILAGSVGSPGRWPG